MVVSKPKECRNPAHSRAMYDAPIISVLPGDFFMEKISSDVIVSFSTSGMSVGKFGLPPTAIQIYLAVTLSTLPLASVSF